MSKGHPQFIVNGPFPFRVLLAFITEILHLFLTTFFIQGPSLLVFFFGQTALFVDVILRDQNRFFFLVTMNPKIVEIFNGVLSEEQVVEYYGKIIYRIDTGDQIKKIRECHSAVLNFPKDRIFLPLECIFLE